MQFLRSLAVATLTMALLAICMPAQKTTPVLVNSPAELITDRLPDADINSEDGGDSPSSELITATTYAFAVTSAALEDMSSGTTQLVGPLIDDNNSTIQPIGFTFRFDGVNHTQFGINTNGFLSLGIAPTGTSFTNSIATTANQPKIMAFWDDLCTGGGTGQVHYKTIGSPGSRKLIVEWKDMKISRNGTCAAAVGNGTFQLWLFETTGVIQFAYGAGTPATTADTGYSIGLQASSITNFASVTTNGGTVSYAVANNAQMDAIPASTSYTFTPNTPTAPSGLNFTGVTAVTITANWTDNSSNESGFNVYRSTDAVNYTLVATTLANATSYGDNGLSPSTTYHYRVAAVSEGAESAPASGSQATPPAGNISSLSGSGLWSAPGTWAGGQVPGAGDNVTIVDGSTVTIDTAAIVLSLKVGNDAPLTEGGCGDIPMPCKASPEGANAILQFESANARSLVVGGNMSIGSSDVFQTAATGTVTTHQLTIGGNLTNNGTFDLSTNGNTAGAELMFTGASNNTFGGTGGTTDIRTLIMHKGLSSANSLELNPSNFTVQGSTTDTAGSGFLAIQNGTFRVSGTFTGTHRTFNAASFIIPASGGFWLSNPNYTVAAQTGNLTVNGLLRNSLGTLNVGTAVDNSVAFGSGSTIFIEGGAVNTAGRFGVGVAATAIINYTQQGGTITTCTVGSTSITLACWDLGTSTAATVVYSITGGTMVVQQASTAASGPRDYRLQSGATGTGTTNVTGGLAQFGNSATTGGAQAFDAAGVFPNVEVNTVAAPHGLTMLAPVTWNNLTRSVNIQNGGTFNIGNNVYLFNGVNFVNNGLVSANAAASNFVTFDATGSATFSGAGQFLGVTTNFAMQCPTNTLNISQQIRVRNLRLFVGSIINANKITLGNNDAIVSVVQFGNTTTPTLAGTLDSAPTFDLGTGGQTITYLRTGNTRTMGPEVNPARTLVTLTYDNNDPATDTLTVAGGDVTVTGAMTLTNGEIITGANKITHNGAVTRTAGLINGTLNRSYTATGAYTYHVGSGSYNPVAATVTTLTTNPSQLSVKSNDGALNGLTPATAVSQYWTLAEVGDLTASLTFTYNDLDINGDENNYLLWKGFPPVQVAGAVMTPAANTAATTGVTAFDGNWGIGTTVIAFGPSDISGTIRTASNRPVANATVTLSGGSLPQPLTTTTGMLGSYGFADVPGGAVYTITVTAKRYTFTPTNRQIELVGDITGVDFVANEQLRGIPTPK